MAIDANMKILCTCLIFVINSLPTRQEFPSEDEMKILDDGPVPKPNNKAEHSDCWMKFTVTNHFATLHRIERTYAKAREAFHGKVAQLLDKYMLEMMESKALHNTREDPCKIPSGTKLGGNCMVWDSDSVLIFPQMKLRNDTVFKINFFENDIANMTLRAHISLKDLRLVGAYERSVTHSDPSVMMYLQSAGDVDEIVELAVLQNREWRGFVKLLNDVQVLLNDVRYKMLGNLRMQGSGFTIETVLSALVQKDTGVTMTFLSPIVSTKFIERTNLDEFIDRVKTNLDLWIKDYINGYFTYFQLNEIEKQFQIYEKSRIKVYNEFSNEILKEIKNRIDKIGLHEVSIPHYTLFALPNMQIQLKKGLIRGFDTIYKRSVATGRPIKTIRNVDIIVGFSNLKPGDVVKILHSEVVLYEVVSICLNGDTKQLAAATITASVSAIASLNIACRVHTKFLSNPVAESCLTTLGNVLHYEIVARVEYQLEVIMPNERIIYGHLQLGADDLTAQLQATAVTDPDTVNLKFKYIEQLKPETLVVTGEAEELISKHKRLLETNIIAIMTNVLKHNLMTLSTLTRCKPLLYSFNNTNKYDNLNNYERQVGKYMYDL